MKEQTKAQYLMEKETSEMTRIPIQKLRNSRSRGVGIGWGTQRLIRCTGHYSLYG